MQHLDPSYANGLFEGEALNTPSFAILHRLEIPVKVYGWTTVADHFL
jgi:hypothetical protein